MRIESSEPAELSLSIRDRTLLYESYMPFVRNGGLFVAAAEGRSLGDQVRLSLHLMHEPEPLQATGKVVWVTPRGAQGNRAAGIGIQFDGKDDALRRKIETYLAGALGSDRRTHTL